MIVLSIGTALVYPALQRWSAFGLSRGADGRSLLVSLFISGAIRLREDGPPEHFDDPQGLAEHVRAIVEPEQPRAPVGPRAAA